MFSWRKPKSPTSDNLRLTTNLLVKVSVFTSLPAFLLWLSPCHLHGPLLSLSSISNSIFKNKALIWKWWDFQKRKGLYVYWRLRSGTFPLVTHSSFWQLCAYIFPDFSYISFICPSKTGVKVKLWVLIGL